MMKNKFWISLALGFVIGFGVAIAEASDARTQTLLIDKLTNVFLKLPEGNPTKTKITLRLADLHAERGRIQAKAELEKGCEQCSNGETDRKKALEYYQYVLPKLKGEQKQNVLVQVGHIYEVLGENFKAIQFYKKVIQGADSLGKAEAQFSLAEIYFKQRNFKLAQNFYQKALSNNSFTRRGLAMFRLSWCQYNRGDISSAIKGLEKILRSPKLLTRGGETLTNVDQDFKFEVAKDFTVFMAHSTLINLSAIRKVYELSPNESRIENISFLAKELERLGRINQSQQAWELVVNETSSPEIRMEALVYLAGLQIKGSKPQKVLPYLKRAFSNWSSLQSCKDQRACDELKKRIRTMVFDWNRMEKKAPSPQLIEAYEAYFRVSSSDVEAYELAAQAATQAKNYEKAYQWNQKAYQLTADNQKKETLLLKRIEISELAKNDAWLQASQSFYLTNSSAKTKNHEIRYQMAQKTYDSKNYQGAAEQFKAIADQASAPAKLRAQSAELALDSLVLLKNDQQIEAWATQFAQMFPTKRKRFLSLAGQSVLSQTAKLSTGAASANAWATLNRFDPSAATPEKQKTFYKNKVILARKLKKFSEMDKALRKYSSFKDLNKDERTFALQNRVWLSEVQLDFAQAYKSYKQLNTGKWLQLARMADLAEKPSSTYYYNYLKTATDKELAFSICVKLIREAQSIGPKQKNCLPYFNNKKDFFAGLILEIYSGKRNVSQLLNLLKAHGLMETAGANVLKRSQLITKAEKQVVRLKKHKLDGRTSRVGRSLKRRMKLIAQFERTISEATGTGDWLTQTLFLTDLKAQYMRFFNELLALPTPKDLSAQEQQEYLSLLSQQAAPYKEKANEIQFKLDELWGNEKAKDQLLADFHQSPKELQSLLGPQIDKLKVADPQKGGEFFLVYRKEQKPKIPSLALLESARQQVKNNPMNSTALNNLIRLETARGYQPMIIYLNSRKNQLSQGFETEEKAL